MLSGISLAPNDGNAVENDIQVRDLSLYNSAGYQQDLSQGYSNQQFNLRGNVTFENLNVAPNPLSYNIIIEERAQFIHNHRPTDTEELFNVAKLLIQLSYEYWKNYKSEAQSVFAKIKDFACDAKHK